ncbi:MULTISPECIES: polymorphic toxin-type HINT domain-containing protein [unclassified Streptomyces]|uniref:polymorphic toxin-type HINT domain-containing protein n=1 Tax=unclassified Streptomyces TaxID=2593676 RepID=UPI00082392CE|nr:polymorphic toxin-type HINT domain-containing protein [Streptomyces sp. AmelKG-E11A]SCK13828.1 intein C-terminal splicing region/RHS repeat-associated core domain-containing protein [Streptomyces sp. AmelKG-E11A]
MLGAALLVGLLPATAFAVPPVPTTGQVGREDTLELEALPTDQPVPGEEYHKNLDTMRADLPRLFAQPPANSVTAPPAGTGTITFGTPVTPAAAAHRAGASSTSRAANVRTAAHRSGPGSFNSAAPAAATADPPPPTPVQDLPVSLGQAPAQPAPTGTWQVSVAARTAPVSSGVDGAVITVQAPATGSVPLSVRLDYSRFRNLHGADWASRLRFVQFPECYLTTPAEEACQEYETLETTNDTAAKAITATVDTTADGVGTPVLPAATGTAPGVLASPYRGTATAAAVTGDKAVLATLDSGGGAGGSFKASPLASAGKWEAGGASGAFTWTYPVGVPAPPAGPAPNISLGYNSQSVDGRTAVTSPQASWIGDGWDYDPGHIERRYRSCEDDRKPLRPNTADPGTPNNTAKKDKTSDLCWVSYNAVMSLGGRTTELVRDDSLTSNPETATEIYRPMNDDGTRVERRTGGTNGDNNGEYWVVTTPDGTTHYYGLNTVGGGHADTDSVSTVPVFGNHPGEPCHEATFAASRCGAGKQQAWRWGLDKVVDIHGNAMVIDWQQAANHYAVKKKFKTPEAYDRAAYPNHIEYGMRSSDLTKPSAKVDFVVAERCLASATVCAPAKFDQTGDPGAYRAWWDTPGNLNCKATSDLCPAFPSFWSRTRLASITTYGQRPGATTLQKVDTHTLHQSFPDGWYSSSPGLWLDSITRRGFAPGDTTGTAQSADGISFSHYTVGDSSPLRDWLKDRQLPNLVPRTRTDQRQAFTRPRIGSVATEHGGEISVEYQGGCAAEPAQDQGQDNTTCYPVRWSPDGEVEKPAKAWFNKYVVASVTERDKVTSHGRTTHHRYRYSGPAWAMSDDEFQPAKLRTHSVWRGHRQVTLTKGSKSSSRAGVPQSQSQSRTRYFLGTGGDLKDSTNTHVLGADSPHYAGTAAESITYRDSGGEILNRVLSRPWSKVTAERARKADDGTPLPALRAHRTGIERSDAIQTTETGWQSVRTLTTVDDTHGLPVEVETAVVKPTSGGGETLSDRTCTRTSYVHNTTELLIGLPKETRATATSCAAFATASPATELIGSARTSYDGLAYGATPTTGKSTTVAEINGEGTDHSVVSTYTYDPLGRPRTVTKPLLGTVETQYTPGDTGGPVTSVKTVNAKGHTSTTTLDPARGLPLTATDPNGRTTRTEYDALGRLVKGWSASRSSGTQTPDVEMAYQSAVAATDKTSPAAVTVRTRKDDGTYGRHITLYDGLARPVQTQSEAHGPGRIITDTTYNDHGLVYERTSGYLAKGEPATDLFQARSNSLIPSTTKLRYDGLERTVRESTYHGSDFKHATYTTHTPTSTYVDPPGTSSPSTQTFTDALGRVTSVRHYTKTDNKTARTTSYTYDARGNRSKVTDTDGNVWGFTHDARGRVTATSDPDTGNTTTRYDDADRADLVTDTDQRKTYSEYDILGRLTKVRHGTPTAEPAKEFTFDPAGALGRPSASIRHTAGGDYIDRVTGYDAEYRPTGRQTVVPANPMTTGLSGTYTYAYAYTPTGKPHSVTLPAKGGLAAETVVTRYNEDGLPESTSGLNWYTADATYSPYGEVLRTVSGSQPDRLWTTNFVDQHTGNLQRTVTDRETAGPHRVSDGYYSYDVSGAITSHARRLSGAPGNGWDNQCFTYDTMRQVVHAWTSNIAPTGTGTGCRSTNGANWGHRTDGAPSSGPVAESVGKPVGTAPPSTTLPASLTAAAPAGGTVDTGATGYRQSYTFDLLGNRATMTEPNPANAANDITHTYYYGKEVPGNGTSPPQWVQPHTLTSVATSTGGGSTYAYDVHGNTKTRDLPATTQQLDWTHENKLDSLTDTGSGTTTRYIYDASGNRLLENSSAGSTLYLGETELTTNATGSITRASRTYVQAGAPAVIRTTNNGSTTSHIRSALITDHLGTANTTVELTGNQPVTRRAAKPYGEARGPQPTTWPNKRGYLGVGIDDKVTGLTHIGAREYDQSTGRFLSADPVIDFADPLQMNGYAYANNTPVTSSDPSGLWIDDGTGKSEPHPKETGRKRSNIGVPRGGTGAGGCYHTCSGPADISQVGIIGVTRDAAREARRQIHGAVDTLASSARQRDAWRKAYRDRLEQKYAKGEIVGVNQIIKVAVNVCFGDNVSCSQDLKNYFQDLDGAVDSSFGLYEGSFGGPKPGRVAAKTDLGRALAARCKCFLAGTDVLMADGTTKDIEDIKVGDKVRAADPETGETGSRTVTRLIRTEDDKHFNELSIATEDGVQKLDATFEHPFWSPSEDAWLEARQLKPGMTLLTDDADTVIVTANREYTRHARTYNLTVEDLHSYYVLAGATPVLVHNSGPNCGVPAGGRNGDRLGGEDFHGSDYSLDEMVEFVNGHTGGGNPAMGRPSATEVETTLRQVGPHQLGGQNSSRFDHNGVRVIINWDMPWKSTSYYPGR